MRHNGTGVRSLFILMILITLAAGCARRPEKAAIAPTPAPTPTPTPTPELGTAAARFGLQFETPPFTPPKVNHAVLGNGITLDHYPEPTIPLVTVIVRIGAGSVHDQPGKVGAVAMAGEIIRNGGSESMDGDTLDRELENRGASISVTSDREATWFRLSVLKEDLTWGVDTLGQLLHRPALPKAKLEESRGRHMVDLRQRLDVPQTVARFLYPELVYGRENPWGWTETSRTLQALTIADLRGVFERFYRSNNMKVGFSGDIDWETAQQMALRAFNRFQPGASARPELPPVPADEQPHVYVVPRELTQNVQYFGHLGVGRFVPEKFAVKVFNNVLSGGFTSRLFKEVRSNRGWAYAIYGQIGEGTRRGLYVNVIYTQVPTADDALDLMLNINRDLQQSPPAPDEMTRAKEADINSFVFFFDSPEKIVQQKMTLDAFGYPPDYLDTYIEKLKAVTPEEVRDAAAKHIRLDQLKVLVIGKVPPELRQRLEAIGPITEISDEELATKWL